MAEITNPYYLPEGLPVPVPDAMGLDSDYWEAARRNELTVQECSTCGNRQLPEWICHKCLSFDLAWVPVAPRGTIYSWERVWYASFPSVSDSLPYLVVVIELDDAPEVRRIGNLLGDPMQIVQIGAPVEAAFEHHDDYTLVQWRTPEGD